MWTHQEYIDFFKTIARLNKRIKHTDSESHFVRIIPVDDPFKSLNVSQYVNDKRSTLHMPAMIFQVPQSTLTGANDATTDVDDIAFIIIDKPKTESYKDEDACLTNTESIARSIVGYLKKYFNSGQSCPMKGFMSLNNVLIDKIQDDKFWGTKVSFRITSAANAEFAYQADDWKED